MKQIQRALLALVLGLTGYWLLVDPVLTDGRTLASTRNSLINYTGLLAIGMMSVAMVLAVRPVWFESQLGGLDKMYRLHRWLGIGTLSASIGHWLLVEAPKWASKLGLMARLPGGRHPTASETVPFFQWLKSLRGAAEAVGEWAFYAAVVLIAIALIKRFPYRWFFLSHRLLAVVYLVLEFHSIVLMNFTYWSTGLAPLMVTLMLAGTGAAGVVLIRRVGERRKVTGTVDRIERFTGVDTLSVGILLGGRWPGHDAGQFAFVTLDPSEGAHPFTMASAWTGDGHVQFLIKELGDYTRGLGSRLQLGQSAEVEGPYGKFNFDGPQRRQIWIGAGIGITPFVAQMKALSIQRGSKPISLIHCTAELDNVAIGKLRADALAAHVDLQVLVDERDGLLSAKRLMDLVPQWREAGVWFCGPIGFGRALRKGLIAQGFDAKHFHQELFDMR
jgi:predicted ferric reductase